MESKLVLHTKTRHINVYAHPENVTHLTKEKMGTLNLQGGTVAYVKQFIDEHNQDESAHPYIQESISTLEGTVTEHIEDTSNPHSVTKEQVGLGNVDNTADLDKPISTATQAALDGKQATISDLATIRSGAALGATAVQPGDLATVATTGDYDDLTNKPTIPSQASDVHALPDTTKYGASLDLDINSSTYVVTAQLKDQDGNMLGTAQTIDLPLESVVVNGSYDSANKKVVLTLQNGSTIEFSVADLVAGLQSEITSSNKLSADLVDDTNTAHKFVTTSEKSTWNGKQDTISDLSTIRSNASAGANAATTIAGYGDIVSHDASEFALDSNAVHKTSDETIAGTKTFTGKVVSPIVETGSNAANYFQSQKFRGQGNADDYRHAIDFGYAYHDQVDFYEYGGKWVFHKHTSEAQNSGDTVVGQILSTGWNGPVVGNVTGTASKATADANGNVITTTYATKNESVKNNDILYDYNSFAANSPNRIYQAKLDNTLYEADKRFTVTLTNFKSGYSSSSNLFDANGETYTRIEKGVSNAQILIEGSNNLGMNYPYGYIYLSFYSNHAPTSLDKISCRVYQNWSGHNVGWVNLTPEAVYIANTAVVVVRFATQNYGINKIEITIDNTNGGYHSEDDYSVWPCDIAFFCNRTGIHSLPVMTKWGSDIKYGNLTIPTANGSFIGNLSGTATKATQDGNGNTISTTYAKKTDIMTGATSSTAGTSGLVPAPAAGDEAKFLRGDGTWVGSTSSAVWGSLTGTLSDQTDLQNALNTKQDALTAGDNIDITQNTISVTGVYTPNNLVAGQNISIEYTPIGDGYMLTATPGTYAYTSQTFDLHNASSWSYNTRYKYQVAGQMSGQWLFGNSNGYYTGPMLFIASNNHLGTYLSSNGTSFDIAREVFMNSLTFQVDRTYDITLWYSSTEGYNFRVTDLTDNQTYTYVVSSNTAHINNTAPTYLMNNMGGLNNSYNQGIMYLANTTIVIDGTTVFNGATAEIGTDLINNGLTVTGTPGDGYYEISSPAIWGGLTGTLSDQTDLQTALDDKLDLDAGNATNTTKQNVLQWGAPDYSAPIDVGFPLAATTYTAPCDGIYVVCFTMNNSNSTLRINGELSGYIVQSASSYRDASSMTIPLSKGDVIYWTAQYSGLQKSIFYPFKGAN